MHPIEHRVVRGLGETGAPMPEGDPEAYLKALVPHLRAKGWYEYAVWYMVDECWQEDQVQANLRLAKLMDQVAPGLKRLMTAPRDPRLYGKSQIWVPGGLPEATSLSFTTAVAMQGNPACPMPHASMPGSAGSAPGLTSSHARLLRERLRSSGASVH